MLQGTGAHEVITTIMLNYVALQIVQLSLRTDFLRQSTNSQPISKVLDFVRVPQLLPLQKQISVPVAKAQRLCPDAVFVPPDFARYRAVSQQIGAIFRRYTPLVEPLSLDEAYLDVTENLRGLPSATETAQAIRAEIRAETGLTASAGVAPNKFLAKIASDWNKPDGLFVVRRDRAGSRWIGPAVAGLDRLAMMTGQSPSTKFALT